jgi:hypothetical protein
MGHVTSNKYFIGGSMNTLDHLALYKNQGIIYSPEIAAILENDIYAMMDFPDSELFKSLPEIVKWCDEHLDSESWGTKEKVESYQKSKGIC